jgi:hypothetical protein
MRRRSVVAWACVGVLLAGGGAAVGGKRLWDERCGAGSESIDPGDVDLPVFAPPSAAPESLRAMVAQAASLGAPFGQLRSVAVDLATGTVRSMPVDLPVTGIDVADDHILVATRTAYLVFDRA